MIASISAVAIGDVKSDQILEIFWRKLARFAVRSDVEHKKKEVN